MRVRIKDDMQEYDGSWLVLINGQSRLTLSRDGKFFATYPISGLEVLVDDCWIEFNDAWSEQLISFYLKGK